MTTAEQLIFTSCRHARGGGSGFQVKSQSPGLDALDVNTIVQRSDYQRPVPADGADAVGAADCPVAVRWYALPSGGRALTRMVYVGTDHTGRPGNFLAHTLAFGAGEASRIDPIAWLDWSGWLATLPPGSDDSPDVPWLAPVHWAPSPPAVPPLPGGATPRLLSRALAGVFEAAATRRSLVLLTTAGENLAWLRLLGRCLPLGHVTQTEFSSYEHNLRQLPALAMTVDGTAIDAQSGRQNGFVCANLVDAARDPAPDGAADPAGLAYGKAVARIVFERSELWQRFTELLARVALAPGADLASMAKVFMLVEAGDEPDAAPLDLLRFVFASRADPSFAALVPRLLASMPALAPASFDDALLLAQAWAGTIVPERRAEQGPPAVCAFAHLLLAALPRWPADEVAVDQVRDALIGGLGSAFDVQFLQAVRRDPAALRSAFLAASPAGAAELLLGVSTMVGGATIAPELDAMVHALVLEPRAAERLEALVVQMPGTAERAAVVEMAGRAPAPAGPELATLLGETLRRASARLPAREAAELRSDVHLAVLLAEWEGALAGPDAVAAHDKLCRAYEDPLVARRLGPPQRAALLLAAARAFERASAVDKLLAVLEEAEQRDLLADLPPSERTRWATALNARLRLDAPVDADVKASLVLLGREKGRLDTVLRPDRGALITLLDALERGHKPGERDLAVLADLDAVSEAERRHARAGLLECAFRGLSSRRDGGLHAALMIGPLRQLGHDATAYRASLAQLVARSDASAVSALVSWWLLDPESSGCERLWSAVARDLATAACRIDAVSTTPEVGAKFAIAATRRKANPARLEQWLEAYEAAPDTGLLQAAYRRVSSALGFGRKKR